MKSESDSERNALVQTDELIAPELSLEEQYRLLIVELTTRDPHRRLAAARDLADLGSPVVPYLVSALSDTTPEHQEAILSTLGLLGRRARAAIPAVEKLCDDERLGPTAKATLGLIRRWFDIDRDRLLDVSMLGAISIVISLGIFKEAGEWVEVWSRLQGAGRAIALGWGMIGGVAGYVIGASLGRDGLAWKGAKAFGVLGTALGVVVGRLVGEKIAPLLTTLDSP